MRWSAKLNLFLGVPNLNEHWLPEHMRFLSTYMAKRPMNLLFPVSVTTATLMLAMLIEEATAPGSGEAHRAGVMLVASLVALGILEHWFLVLPMSEEVLWRWALRLRRKAHVPLQEPYERRRMPDWRLEPRLGDGGADARPASR
jgi:putative photosynthetic complex assembly protein 2